jgi:hypothetical protein
VGNSLLCQLFMTNMFPWMKHSPPRWLRILILICILSSVGIFFNYPSTSQGKSLCFSSPVRNREYFQVEKFYKVDVDFCRDTWVYSDHHHENKLYSWSNNIQTKIPLNRKVYFHMFWKFLDDSEKIGSHIPFVINSFLATQDLNHTSLILWSNRNLTLNEDLSFYFQLPFVETRVYNPFELAKGTILEGNVTILTQNDSYVYSDGDLFRILVLYNYGGVYIDADVVLLRDFTPLLNQQVNLFKICKNIFNERSVHLLLGLSCMESGFYEWSCYACFPRFTLDSTSNSGNSQSLYGWIMLGKNIIPSCILPIWARYHSISNGYVRS